MGREIDATTVPPMLPVMVAAVMGLIVSASTVVTALQGVPPPTNCTRACGGIQVPYPFGLDDGSEDCYIGYGFSLTCNPSYDPPKIFWGNIEVQDIIFSSGHIRILSHISYDCYNSSYNAGVSARRVTLGDFMVSFKENIFIAIGCDTEARFKIGTKKYGGCMTGCNSLDDTEDGQCLGIGCCQSQIPRQVNFYNTSFVYRNESSETYKFNNCSYFFIVEKNNYTFRKSDLTYMNQSTKFPMILDWFIGNQRCVQAKLNSASYACFSNDSDCVDSKNGPGYFCKCSRGYQGNPYLKDGCKDIDECTPGQTTYPCFGNCVNTNGSYNCTCAQGFYSEDPKRQPCYPIKIVTTMMQQITRKVIIAISTFPKLSSKFHSIVMNVA